MKTATYFLLTIKHGKLVVEYDGTNGGAVTRSVRSIEDLADFLRSKASEAGVSVDDLTIMRSSSLDYPEESDATTDTINMIHVLDN